ncbi:MAG: hypothetical protein COW24_03220 [Candidatus Kerfeldbacteria bacterium CG15_BIG_FIL_POST_REV_8_21_14_020_45_12]|uniref:Uncharacterized protein n=1 Tax=Candidatus Kerfeldbacteria bacterium CG15_BIG_FIL_POST_REV_8_21_14_020_45_12 TaxID=2014247 RepID=A0A2M7H3L7_9BACT|nr:MAG: hypothetical protein COW24_03220 [Candidatus Kerfeldbacteria bacterium CG15_BIG_FIL_POST_REV_8_21_14_020_45_12]PJA93442.1 MAG: hypothetical protein CO132_03025 [Candidatus Kerfeldbacteria bacterium CG_4_9_14_3_um_filter_45_8]
MDTPSTQNNDSQSSAQPQEPVDVFASVDALPERLTHLPGDGPAQVPPPAPQLQITKAASSPRRRRVGRGSRVRLIVLGISLALFLVVIIVFYVLPMFSGKTKTYNPVIINDSVPNPVNQIVPINDEPVINTNVNTSPSVVTDSDGDGLSDERETSLGTNRLSADSDADGLTDRQEVDVYQTNPLDEDSDDDSYLDGEEVRKFYNPNGPGKLLDIKSEINNLGQSAN